MGGGTGPLNADSWTIKEQIGAILQDTRQIPTITAQLGVLTEQVRGLSARNDSVQDVLRDVQMQQRALDEQVARLTVAQAECPGGALATRLAKAEGGVATAYDLHSRVNLRLRVLDDLRIGPRLDTVERDVATLQREFSGEAGTPPPFSRVEWERFKSDMEWMRPWVAGLRWAMLIAGGLLVVTLVGGLLWAVVQSGAAGP